MGEMALAFLTLGLLSLLLLIQLGHFSDPNVLFQMLLMSADCLVEHKRYLQL